MSKEVGAYYNRFLRSRMVSYRVRGNKRLDLAYRSIRDHLRPNSSIADIGCGIGIISEKIARKEKSSIVFGVDISPANIEYAKRTINLGNVHFLLSDVSNQLPVLQEASPDGFDLVVMVDVIEHIPEGGREPLLSALFTLAKPSGRLFLSFPSPEYQLHLIANEPHHLQLIDNVVNGADLVREASSAGWQLKSFSYVDVWRRNQYVHAVFAKPPEYFPLPVNKPNIIERGLTYAGSAIQAPVRHWKYVKRPFRHWPDDL